MSRQTYNVLDVTYHYHTEPDGSCVFEARYVTSIRNGDRLRTFSEYLDFESDATKDYCAKWWKERSPDPVPVMNQHAVDVADYHGISEVKAIVVEYGITGYRIIGKQTSEIPPGISEIW